MFLLPVRRQSCAICSNLCPIASLFSFICFAFAPSALSAHMEPSHPPSQSTTSYVPNDYFSANPAAYETFLRFFFSAEHSLGYRAGYARRSLAATSCKQVCGPKPPSPASAFEAYARVQALHRIQLMTNRVSVDVGSTRKEQTKRKSTTYTLRLHCRPSLAYTESRAFLHRF